MLMMLNLLYLSKSQMLFQEVFTEKQGLDGESQKDKGSYKKTDKPT